MNQMLCEPARSATRVTVLDTTSLSTSARIEPQGRDLDSAIDQSHFALGEIVRGNPEPYQVLLSHREDVTLGNPFGPFVRGWDQVADTAADAASRYRDGEIIGFDPIARYVSDDLACIVEVERFRAKVGGSQDLASVALRVTSIYRKGV
jgi:hypothetical protein